MHVRVGRGILYDNGTLLGDMVHYLAKASFLQNLLLGMFVSFWFVCLGFGFVCNHWYSESFFIQQALRLHNISCIVVSQWQSSH
jgi:hypothetical protein